MKNFTSQRILCKKLLKSTKRTYFNNLDIRKLLTTEDFEKLLFHSFQTNYKKEKNKFEIEE